MKAGQSCLVTTSGTNAGTGASNSGQSRLNLGSWQVCKYIYIYIYIYSEREREKERERERITYTKTYNFSLVHYSFNYDLYYFNVKSVFSCAKIM